MKTTVAIALLIVAAFYFGGCHYKNVRVIKENSAKVWNASGFEVVGYEGFQIGHPFGAPGGKVWYIVQRKGDPKIRYSGCVTKWGDEFHLYNLSALDAISP